jgi:Fe-Mn family superoxide dismutase
MTQYVLPDLAYDYGALEPHISGRVMELHHDKHHRTYVDGANQVLEQLAETRARNDFTRLAALEHALAFHVSGHLLHSLFWQNLGPDGGGEPNGDLGETIERDFGSFQAFRAQLSKAAETHMGSGWAVLLWEPLSARLLTAQIHDHQSHTIQGSVPLLVLDAWEHAYYAQYANEKKKFFEAVWNVWNWDDVARRFAEAQSATLSLASATDTSRAKGSTRQQPAGRA